MNVPCVLLADNLSMLAGFLSLRGVLVEDIPSPGTTESAYCLLALHHQLVQLIELTDDSLSLR